MARFESSQAALRIFGDSLLPEEVTRLLGCAPTASERKGERIAGPKTGTVRVARTGLWRLRATEQAPEDLPGQIDELLGRLTSDMSAWAKIRETCRIDLFVGLFMSSGNNGLSISPAQLLALGERGIELDLDVYDHSED
ncbi:DUF4279 domain-containing protein [Dyella nitratireducens]|uniref:DUF4279 domain-containing protein n=1 Tax=Dyella nitratireducens TaxID=1849580 RepID=A0ABQ1FUL3_9GAMM|nr:DUF4279 domain-containing protein [Dyella nitratireducens]GGA29610.1 hypothetical protein GCM10010981_18210 [Dyella nitratireducens]GLQ43115.1 hypothetical protein GCM10007902_29650 [Dyella nitratireducens]